MTRDLIDREAESRAIRSNIKAYEAMQSELESKHKEQWVVFHSDRFINAYPSFEDAAADAVKRFGRGPYLIRQVGVKWRMIMRPTLVRDCE